MKLKETIVKDFRKTPVTELAESPVYALYGISDRNALALYKTLHVETIEDLANLKYSEWAKEICDLADSGAASLDLKVYKDRLIKKYWKMTPQELADGPIHVFYGLSRKSARLLSENLHIHTVRDLSNLKYISWARSIDYRNRLVKDYENFSLSGIVGSPVYALQGLSEKDAKRLEKAFSIETVEDLATLPFHQVARDICDLADADEEDSAREKKVREGLVKAYQKKTLKQLTRAPVSAIKGVSKKDEKLLQDAFRVKTIRKFAELKYIRWARDMVELNRSHAMEVRSRPVKKSGISALTISLIFLLIILLVAGFAFYRDIMKFFGLKSPEREADLPVKGTAPSEVTDITSEREAKEAVKAEPASVDLEEAAEEDEKQYIVKPKDTLVSISEELYGDYRKWEDIYRLNRETIKRPWLIFPGQRLKLPPGRITE